MPSNEERREVAARLRKKHGERQWTFEPQSISIQAMNRMDDLLDCLPERRDMFLVLADLIEPEERTCRMEPNEKGYVICSNCGEEIDAYTCDWTEPMEYSYQFCYACGAKVVERC